MGSKISQNVNASVALIAGGMMAHNSCQAILNTVIHQGVEFGVIMGLINAQQTEPAEIISKRKIPKALGVTV